MYMALSGRDNSKDIAFYYWFKLKQLSYLKHWHGISNLHVVKSQGWRGWWHQVHVHRLNPSIPLEMKGRGRNDLLMMSAWEFYFH